MTGTYTCGRLPVPGIICLAQGAPLGKLLVELRRRKERGLNAHESSAAPACTFCGVLRTLIVTAKRQLSCLVTRACGTEGEHI